LTGRVAVITGGAGLLGVQHAEAIAECGGVPYLLDIDSDAVEAVAKSISEKFSVNAKGICCDITNLTQIKKTRDVICDQVGRVDILINNAANNPKVEHNCGATNWSRFENFPLEAWNRDLAVGLTGAFLCSQIFGTDMATAGSGVILNIASDLALIAPDQRIYMAPGETPDTQIVKPVTYSVAKAGLIGLTRYLATYWPHRNVRANALAPGGVAAGQEDAFVKRLTSLIPMGRMAAKHEYKGAVVFMVSDASSYLNGAIISVDGGRTVW
jgi:NAD(P)-dependent dehydrogenase (short-subunit alcohol dehydrogenase family)